eukprot:4967309-Amphidinium_carterae.1
MSLGSHKRRLWQASGLVVSQILRRQTLVNSCCAVWLNARHCRQFLKLSRSNHIRYKAPRLFCIGASNLDQQF